MAIEIVGLPVHPLIAWWFSIYFFVNVYQRVKQNPKECLKSQTGAQQTMAPRSKTQVGWVLRKELTTLSRTMSIPEIRRYAGMTPKSLEGWAFLSRVHLVSWDSTQVPTELGWHGLPICPTQHHWTSLRMLWESASLPHRLWPAEATW